MLLVMRTQARYLVLHYEVQTCFPTLLHLLAAGLGHFRKKNLKRKPKMSTFQIVDDQRDFRIFFLKCHLFQILDDHGQWRRTRWCHWCHGTTCFLVSKSEKVSKSLEKSRKVSKSKSRSLEWHQLFLPSFGANEHICS